MGTLRRGNPFNVGLVFLQGLLAEVLLVRAALVWLGSWSQGTGAPLLQLQVLLQAGLTLFSEGSHPDPLL